MKNQLRTLWIAAWQYNFENALTHDPELLQALWTTYPRIADKDTKRLFDELCKEIAENELAIGLILDRPECHSDSDQ